MPSKLETIPAIVTQIADAIVDALAGGEFSEDVAEGREVKRFDTPKEALHECPPGKVRLAVLKEAVRRTQQTRAKKQIECDISVAIIRKIDPDEDDELTGDRMHLLSQELAEFLEEQQLQTPAGLNVRHQETTIKLLYSPVMLDENGLYMLPTTFTYRTYL